MEAGGGGTASQRSTYLEEYATIGARAGAGGDAGGAPYGGGNLVSSPNAGGHVYRESNDSGETHSGSGGSSDCGGQRGDGGASAVDALLGMSGWDDERGEFMHTRPTARGRGRLTDSDSERSDTERDASDEGGSAKAGADRYHCGAESDSGSEHGRGSESRHGFNDSAAGGVPRGASARSTAGGGFGGWSDEEDDGGGLGGTSKDFDLCAGVGGFEWHQMRHELPSRPHTAAVGGTSRERQQRPSAGFFVHSPRGSSGDVQLAATTPSPPPGAKPPSHRHRGGFGMRPHTASLAGRMSTTSTPLSDAEQRERWWRHQVAVANSTTLGHHNTNRVAPLERLRLRRRRARRKAVGGEEESDADLSVSASELERQQRQDVERAGARHVAEHERARTGVTEGARATYDPGSRPTRLRQRVRPSSAAPKYSRSSITVGSGTSGVIKGSSAHSGEVFGSNVYDVMFDATISAPEVFAVGCVDSEMEE